jgi:hypothetical protein
MKVEEIMLPADDPASTQQHEVVGPKKRQVNWIARFIVGAGVVFFLYALLLPSVQRVREVKAQTDCKSNLKQIGIALHSYHLAYRSLPPAYTVDDQGQRLHSWRTLILPFLDRGQLYESIDLSKPWSHPVNVEARQTAQELFKCPAAKKISPNETTYLAISTANSCFPGIESRTYQDITDKHSETFMVVEVCAQDAIEWMQPDDLGELAFKRYFSSEKDLTHFGGMQVLLADGTVRFISRNMALDLVDGLMTISGREVVGEF